MHGLYVERLALAYSLPMHVCTYLERLQGYGFRIIASQPCRLYQLVLYDSNIFVTPLMDGGVLLLQRARDKDREAAGSPDYGRVPRHSRERDWHGGSPVEYYERSSRHFTSRSPRRSASWTPPQRRDERHKQWTRKASATQKWSISPEDSYRGAPWFH